MKAMILASGVGSRLDPLTRYQPKPLVPIANTPVMEHVINLLRNHGFIDVIVNVHYLADQIIHHFGNGSTFGVRLHWVREDRLWGDAGSIKRLEGLLDDETLLAIGCDDLSEIDLTELVQFHRDNKAIATMALSEVNDPTQYGVASTDTSGRIRQFQEKPDSLVACSNRANTGIYVLSPDVLDHIPPGKEYLIGKHLIPRLVEQNLPVFGYESPDYWVDIGNLKTYYQAHHDVLAGRVKVNLGLPEVRSGVWIGANTSIHPSAKIVPPVVIGSNCRIGADTQLLENTVLGSGCRVREGAVVKDSILWKRCQVMQNTWVERCILVNDCMVQADAAIFGGIVCKLPLKASPKQEVHEHETEI